MKITLKALLLFIALILILVLPAAEVIAENLRNDTAIDIETAQFIQGHWKVKTFLGFQMITKDDVEYPDGEKILGKTVVISPNLFSTADFAPEYEKYAVDLWWGHYNIVDELSGEEFYSAYKVGKDVTKIEDNDRVIVIQAESEAGDLSGPLLIDVNHERLLLYLNCDYFELGKNYWTENDMSVSIYDIGAYAEDYDFVEYNNNKAELISLNEPIYLLMINGGFVPFPDIKIIDGRALTPVKNILEPLGAGYEHNSENQTVIITNGSTTMSLKIGGAQVDAAAPMLVNGELYVPIRLIAEFFGADVEYIASLSNGGSAIHRRQAGGPVSVISVEIPGQPEKIYSHEEGLLNVNEASAAEYKYLLEYYKSTNRKFDKNNNKDYDPQDIAFTGDTYGRYYVYRLQAFPNYNIFFNKYTGEIFCEHAGLPFLFLTKGFINISWIYQ